jgi:heme exporter protein C
MRGGGDKRAGFETLVEASVSGAVAVPAAAVILAICLVAPTEATMGHAQRIVYVHVAVAWLGLLGFLVTAVTGLVYLVRRDLAWDHWSQAAAELGWLCGGLTLVTGSLWAHTAWGVWWTWDPRLTTAFILWAIYSAYLIVRTGIDDPCRRARIAAVLAVIGALDVPLVVLAARWFRGIHPASPGMEPSMRLVLIVSVAGFTALFAALCVRRRRQLHLASLLAAIQQRNNSEEER